MFCTLSTTLCCSGRTSVKTRDFWNRVKLRIKEKGTTQEETAKAAKVSFSTLRNWMTRNINPPLMYAFRISRYLGVSLDYLIAGQGKDEISKTHEEIIVLLKQAEDKLIRIR